MHISILRGRFANIGCRGVAAFATAVKDRKLGTRSMALIREMYSTVEPARIDRGNELYTVEQYLSDLLSRVRRLNRTQFKYVNETLGRYALHIRQESVRDSDDDLYDDAD